VRTAKFVARKQWVITGADDMYIRVYNHNTMEKIKSFEAHTDYIRRVPAPLPPLAGRTRPQGYPVTPHNHCMRWLSDMDPPHCLYVPTTRRR